VVLLCSQCNVACSQILSVYMSGSKNMSYDSSNLTTPDIKWLGVRPSDLDRRALNAIPPRFPFYAPAIWGLTPPSPGSTFRSSAAYR